jgi:hypothetical protein
VRDKSAHRGFCEAFLNDETPRGILGRVGHEQPTLAPSRTSISKDSGAKSDAEAAQNPIQDPNLARIVEAWPELPEHVKAAIKALVQTHVGRVK